MNESIAAIEGLGLGAIFYGGLWWTVRRGLTSDNPGLWFLGSLLVRTSVVLAGFLAVSGGHWERLVICLIGFVVARVAVTRLTRPGSAKRLRLRAIYCRLDNIATSEGGDESPAV